MKKPLPPQKQDFFDLLDRAVRTTDPTSHKSKKSGGYSGKKTGQHRSASALKKRSDKSHRDGLAGILAKILKK